MVPRALISIIRPCLPGADDLLVKAALTALTLGPEPAELGLQGGERRHLPLVHLPLLRLPKDRTESQITGLAVIHAMGASAPRYSVRASSQFIMHF